MDSLMCAESVCMLCLFCILFDWSIYHGIFNRSTWHFTFQIIQIILHGERFSSCVFRIDLLCLRSMLLQGIGVCFDFPFNFHKMFQIRGIQLWFWQNVPRVLSEDDIECDNQMKIIHRFVFFCEIKIKLLNWSQHTWNTFRWICFHVM